MNCNNNKVKTIPTKISLYDNRCFAGACEKCKEFTYYCEHIKKYMHCKCCKEKNND
jgi:hypothetical protein